MVMRSSEERAEPTPLNAPLVDIPELPTRGMSLLSCCPGSRLRYSEARSAPPKAQTLTRDSHSMRLFKPPDLLNLVHQVAAVHVLHHKIQAILENKMKINSSCTRACHSAKPQAGGSFVSGTEGPFVPLQNAPGLSLYIISA